MAIIYKAGFRAADAEQDASPDTLTFVMSDETTDRMGDIITASGWDLVDFRKNPVALYGHNNDGLPIGRWENVRVVGKKLIGTLRFAKAGTSPFVDWVRRLFEQKMLNAVSVGFQEIDSEPIDPDRPWRGMRFLKQALWECSVVTVPANPNAIVQRALASAPPDIRALLLAETGQGKPAIRTKASPAATGFPHPDQGVSKMSSISEMIQADRDELIALNDQQTEFNAKIAEGEDLTAEEGEQFDQIEAKKAAIEKRLERRLQAEKTMGYNASQRQQIIPPPLQSGGAAMGPTQLAFAQAKSARERPMDTIVRLGVLSLKAHVERKSINQVLFSRPSPIRP